MQGSAHFSIGELSRYFERGFVPGTSASSTRRERGRGEVPSGAIGLWGLSHALLMAAGHHDAGGVGAAPRRRGSRPSLGDCHPGPRGQSIGWRVIFRMVHRGGLAPPESRVHPLVFLTAPKVQEGWSCSAGVRKQLSPGATDPGELGGSTTSALTTSLSRG